MPMRVVGGDFMNVVNTELFTPFWKLYMNTQQYTDVQLKQALAKMLPRERRNQQDEIDCLDTELLHLCWLVEETLNPSMLCQSSKEWADYVIELGNMNKTSYKSNIHASWQQRVVALAKVKGVSIT